MNVLVAYESDRGHTRRAAEALASAAAARGIPSLVMQIGEIEEKHLANVDAIVAGCWLPGKVPFGDPPTRRMLKWIDGLSALDGMTVALFCTYRFLPHTFADTATRTAETLFELGSRFEAKGAQVAATRAIWMRYLDKGARILVDGLLEHAPAA